MQILSIDQGTTNTKAVLVEASGRIVAQASSSLVSEYPHPGWAEQSALAIWASVQTVIAEIVAQSGPIDGITIANQRETLVVWDATTSQPVAPAILWQCRRTADSCAALLAAGHGPTVTAATGLAINPLFPASKLAWVLQNIPPAQALAAKGTLRAGTVDAWLLWNLTAGASFATDHSNASRTMLFNTGALAWDATLATIFGVPLNVLPTPRPSDSRFGTTANTTALPPGIPILAMMGDSHAALYGHGIRHPGTVKATFGTGSSLMALTPKRIGSTHGLSGTIAWTTHEGTAYAIEGNITVSAQAAAFAAELLGLPDAAALSDLAQTVPTSNGVTFVPALAGLGAPHWKDHATGTIDGLTLGTRPAHLARATFEAITLQIADVFTAIEHDIGTTLADLRADGGASANPFLMQLQADVLNRPVIRNDLAEVGALGAAAMGFAALGVDPTAVLSSAAQARVFAPAADPVWRDKTCAQWQAAIRRALAC